MYYCSKQIKLQRPAAKEVIVSYGKMFFEVYVLNKGRIDFFLGNDFSHYRLITMNKGYHYGDVNMLSHKPSEFTLKARGSNTEVYTLSKSLVHDLKNNFAIIT